MATSSIFTNIVIDDPKKQKSLLMRLKNPAVIQYGSRQHPLCH